MRTTFRGSSGGAWSHDFGAAGPVALTADTLTVHDNRGGIAAFVLRPVDSFTCTACDFGAGPDDNDPADVSDGTQTAAQAPTAFSF